MNVESNIIRDRQEGARLKTFWNSRYEEFSLRESGIKSLTPIYSQLLYRCKKNAYRKALAKGGIDPSKPVRILDGGCGQGFFASVVRQVFQSPTYVGIDISEKAITFLKSRFQEFEWICADLADDKLGLPQKFNVAQSIEVLHLILDDANHSQAISNLVSNLLPNGILIVTDILPPKRTKIDEFIIFRPTDYYDNLFNRLGLECLNIFPMYYWIPDMGMALPRLRRLFRIIPPNVVYYFDRLFLKLRIPQVNQSHDSKMKMIVCRKAS